MWTSVGDGDGRDSGGNNRDSSNGKGGSGSIDGRDSGNGHY
jgi:hypothetical protein